MDQHQKLITAALLCAISGVARSTLALADIPARAFAGEHADFSGHTMAELIAAHPLAFLAAAFCIILLVIAGALLYIMRERKRNRKTLLALERSSTAREQEAAQKIIDGQKRQLEAAYSQTIIKKLHPHFLYNALSAIRTIIKHEPDYAYDLLYDFTQHLRAAIRALGSDSPIPFCEESDNIKAYLNIEKMSMENLKVEFDLQSDDFDVVPLSIQEFVKNAVRRGIQPKGEAGGTVRISSHETESDYIVEISDDGIGFDVDTTLGDEARSMTLRNNISKLKNLVNAEVSIESKVNEGTRVTVTIPNAEDDQ